MAVTPFLRCLLLLIGDHLCFANCQYLDGNFVLRDPYLFICYICILSIEESLNPGRKLTHRSQSILSGVDRTSVSDYEAAYKTWS